MKNLFKGKLGTVLILLATLVLAGVAVFTAIRLYDLRNQSVAPNAPSSVPHAAGVISNEGGACGGATQNSPTCATGLTCVITQIGTGVGTCQKTDQNTCSLSFTLNTATTTPTPTATTHATVTPTPTATSTSVPQCNDVCTTSAQCSATLTCDIPTGSTSGHCRRAACLSEASCVCATPTPTATPTTNPTGTPNSCNGTCGSNFNCQNGLMCYQGFCRNPSCASNSSCSCGGTATATPTAPALPQSGTDWPTVAGFGLGIFVIVGSLLLAL